MASITLTNSPKVSIYELCSLSEQDLSILAKEADETLLAARRLKEWINGAIVLKNSNYKYVKPSNNDNNTKSSGGNHA